MDVTQDRFLPPDHGKKAHHPVYVCVCAFCLYFYVRGYFKSYVVVRCPIEIVRRSGTTEDVLLNLRLIILDFKT